MYKKEFMEIAVNEAREGIISHDGGPFGAVIVKNGEVVASGHNRVLSSNDSTCHGEIDAIRKAESRLGTYDLLDCELYTTGEPCPMCLAAILWANIKKVYYGCRLNDNDEIGFRDAKFDKMMGGRSSLPEGFMEEKDREMCLRVFKEYEKMNMEKY
ncbi:nucleoside deaminase [Candidatus Saccharibacteria bacterium]|nr:nucleoside deaminase [Candidatus Saccharibacteria bacterium]MBR3233431.1 nucleoside deaminase [Candidatus Saccharibacteria bacterium]